MPLIIPKDLPAYEELQQENVFVMHQERAMSQHIRPLRILILNLMPTKIVTETQLARLLANSPLQVQVTFLQTATHSTTHTAPEHMKAFYKTFDEIKNERFDGMIITADEARAYIKYQVGALQAFCRAEGLELQHVKPHGALYNAMARDPALAEAVCRGIRDCGSELIVMALAGSIVVDAAKSLGLPVAQEVFADRAYEEDGSLVDRRKEGSMITDEQQAIARVIRMVTEGKVKTITGKDIPVSAHSVCVHGDGPKALAFVQSIHAALQKAGITVAPLREVI